MATCLELVIVLNPMSWKRLQPCQTTSFWNFDSIYYVSKCNCIIFSTTSIVHSSIRCDFNLNITMSCIEILLKIVITTYVFITKIVVAGFFVWYHARNMLPTRIGLSNMTLITILWVNKKTPSYTPNSYVLFYFFKKILVSMSIWYLQFR